MAELLIERTARQRPQAHRPAIGRLLRLGKGRAIPGLSREERIRTYRARAARRLPLFASVNAGG